MVTCAIRVLYRIKHATHHNTGDAWCIYPMYDFAHGQSKTRSRAITHSICTLEFENHRPLYDWLLDNLSVPLHPQQIEFARLNLTYTVLSKRKLIELVEAATSAAGTTRACRPSAACAGAATRPRPCATSASASAWRSSTAPSDMVQLENALRDDLNRRAPRALAVLRPLRLLIENYPEGQSEELDAVNNPEDESAGTRKVPFSRVLYVERDDFRAEAPRKYFRLTPGREVRLRYAYYVTCTGFETDPATGEVTEVRCTYDPETRGGDSADGRKVKGTIHWVSAEHAFDAEVRQLDHLFSAPNPLDRRGGGRLQGPPQPGAPWKS